MITPPASLDPNFWTAVASIVVVIAFTKSAINGTLRKLYGIFGRVGEELDRIEDTQGQVSTLGVKMDSLGERTDNLRADIKEVGREVDKIKRIQRASLKYENGNFDAAQAIDDLSPEEDTLERYRDEGKD